MIRNISKFNAAIIKSLIVVAMLLVCSATTIVSAQTESIKKAEIAYTSEQYAEAIELYEEVLKANGDSPELYYNLGNAYFKSGNIASAILNYERALRLDPSDEDVLFNLEMAHSRTVDKIEKIDRFFLTEWNESLRRSASADQWAGYAIGAFIFFLVGVTLFLFSKRRFIKKMGFFSAIVMLLFSFLFNVYASSQKNWAEERADAIVMSETVTVKSSPDASGTDLFILHSGTKVTIQSSLGSWSEVMLIDGNIGWMPTADIEQI